MDDLLYLLSYSRHSLYFMFTCPRVHQSTDWIYLIAAEWPLSRKPSVKRIQSLNGPVEQTHQPRSKQLTVFSEQERVRVLYPYPLLGSPCNENRTQQSGWDCRCFPQHFSRQRVWVICSACEPNEQGSLTAT